MSDVRSDDDRTSELMELVERSREERTRAVLQAAEEQAAALVREARKDNRRRLRQAILEASERAERRIALARADVATEHRHLDQRSSVALLKRAWEGLQRTMRERWNDPATRRKWTSDLIDLALAEMPPGPWRVEHPPGWASTEIEEAATRIRTGTGQQPIFAAADDIEAGARIGAGVATLDGTSRGLLASPDEVRGRLLAELATLTTGSSEQP